MVSVNRKLSAAILAAGSEIRKCSVLITFENSINDRALRNMIKVYPAVQIIAEQSLQVGNVRRAVKYCRLLQMIAKTMREKQSRYLSDFESRILNE